MTPEEEEQKYYEEELARVNALCAKANQRGLLPKSKTLKPPKLNPDGSEAKEQDDE